MAARIRVMLVGAPGTTQTLRRDLEASDLEVVGEVVGTDEVAEDARSDVLLFADESGLDAAADWHEGAMPAIVVMTDSRRNMPDLARFGAPGWAIVARDASVSELRAAVIAAAHGFSVQPVSLESAGEDLHGRLPMEALTAREREVLELLSRGMSNKTIASRLGISEHTVKFHLSSIFSKLGASSRTEAVRRGVQAGLIAL